MKFLVLVSLLAMGPTAFAKGGDHAGNGGDICENRFQLVRDDIASWILNGGSEGLQLPAAVTLAQYNQGMMTQIKSAKVSCSEEPLYVGAAEKTCKNFIANDGSAIILCNVDRFMKTSAADQYTLVHHEYAGLAGFEVNNGESSNYFISNQLTGFLENQTVKRLVVRKNPDPVSGPFASGSCKGPALTPEAVRSSIEVGKDSRFLGAYEIFSRQRNCNTFTGCGAWTNSVIGIVQKSGFYSAKIVDNQGTVSVNFTSGRSWCSFDLASGFNCSLDKQIKDAANYSFEPASFDQNCLQLRGSQKQYTEAGSPNYVEKEIVLFGQHPLSPQPVSPAFENRDIVVQMSCYRNDTHSRGCSSGSATSESDYTSPIKFRLKDGTIEVLDAYFHFGPDSKKCTLSNGTCHLPFSRADKHGAAFVVKASGNYITISNSGYGYGGYGYPTCNEYSKSYTCNGTVLQFK